MINLDTWSPTAHGDLAYDADLSPSLRAIDIKAPGSLFVIDIDDNEVDYTFVAPDYTGTAAQNVTTFPYRLELQIKRIVGDGSGSAGDGNTGTDIALANLVGLI
jgi:hypothetical protein